MRPALGLQLFVLTAVQAKEDVTDLLKQKGRGTGAHWVAGWGLTYPADLEKEKKDLLASAAEKERLLKAKVRTIGNIVHDSVPVSNNEVRGELIFVVR